MLLPYPLFGCPSDPYMASSSLIELSTDPRCEYSAQPPYCLCLVTLSGSTPPHTTRTCWTSPAGMPSLSFLGSHTLFQGIPVNVCSPYLVHPLTPLCQYLIIQPKLHCYPAWALALHTGSPFHTNTLLTLHWFLICHTRPLPLSSSWCELLPSCSGSNTQYVTALHGLSFFSLLGLCLSHGDVHIWASYSSSLGSSSTCSPLQRPSSHYWALTLQSYFLCLMVLGLN